MSSREIPLEGGNVSVVVRISDTVRRTAGPWTAAVHHLLRYLEALGFAEAPRALGFDEQGREILSFIPGQVGHYPLPDYVWSDDTLAMVARLLRRLHKLTADYVPPPGAHWQFVYPDHTRHEVICHTDYAPYNMVFEHGTPKAIIDWDMAGPGPRLWDIGYALYRFVPLSWEPDLEALGLTDPGTQRRRITLFCDAYELSAPDRAGVLEAVHERLEHLCTNMVTRAAAGDEAFQRMIDEGHLALYRREIAALKRHRPDLSTVD